MLGSVRPVGDLLREWRQRRRMSQLELALEAEVSTRHLSFVETGRSRPSREMVLHLAEQLDLPLRERNQFLLAAGYAPVYAETELDSPQMAAVRRAIRQVLAGHEPYPAVVVDRGWNLVDANAGVELFTDGIPQELLGPPTNVLRVSLHPAGLAPRIAGRKSRLRAVGARAGAGLLALLSDVGEGPLLRLAGRGPKSR